ncbi:MAG: S24/S26 family peptidase [Bacteroidales bacterium]|nr:S24/S26 family peptidase [Bacteroidales bacterium]
MIRFFHNEEWKEFKREGNPKFRYSVSNYGRLASFTDKIENGCLLKCGEVKGYKTFQYVIFKKNGNVYRRLFIYKLVATHFLPPKSDDQTFVLHIDHSRNNDHFENLRWATKEELLEHTKKSPRMIKSRKNRVLNMKRDGHKLTATKVLFIKKKLLSPNRKTRLKIIAKQFGVSEMTLHRIRTGENWGHIKVTPDNENSKDSEQKTEN